MKVVIGDITKAKDEYVLQQCNCISTTGRGLYKTLSDKFPYADPYRTRGWNRADPGTFEICEPPEGDIYGGPKIVCLYGQFCYGKPNHYETEIQRVGWFSQALDAFGQHLQRGVREGKVKNKATIAIPHNIGCGLAGGNWAIYTQILTLFSQNHTNVVDVTVYKLHS